MDCPITAYMRVLPRTEFVALLADEDLAGGDALTPEALYAAALGCAISAVTGGASGFLMCHLEEL
jgi:hypothetical protein